MLRIIKKLNNSIIFSIFIVVAIVLFSGNLGSGEFLNNNVAFGYGAITTITAPVQTTFQSFNPTTGELTTVASDVGGGITSATETAVSAVPGVPAVNTQGEVTLGQIVSDAIIVASGDVNKIVADVGVVRNLAIEANISKTVVADLVQGTGVTAQVRNIITSFITYGTKATKALGSGERAGVVSSFKSAFGKLPASASEWSDVVKISNGRWPNQRSIASESKAVETFKSVYLRSPNRSNPNDDAAVTVMSYGLRPVRNLGSEKIAINTFKDIFGFNPSSSSDWDTMRAIAYSGATR